MLRNLLRDEGDVPSADVAVVIHSRPEMLTCGVGYSRGGGCIPGGASPPDQGGGDSDGHRDADLVSLCSADKLDVSLVNGSNKSTQRCSGLSQGALIAPISKQAKPLARSCSANPFSHPIPVALGPGEGSCSHLLADNGPEQSCPVEQHQFQAGKSPERLRALELTPRAGSRRNIVGSAPRFALRRGPLG